MRDVSRQSSRQDGKKTSFIQRGLRIKGSVVILGGRGSFRLNAVTDRCRRRNCRNSCRFGKRKT